MGGHRCHASGVGATAWGDACDICDVTYVRLAGHDTQRLAGHDTQTLAGHILDKWGDACDRCDVTYMSA